MGHNTEVPYEVIKKYGTFPEFDCLYDDLFASSQRIVTFFVHSRRWRETNLEYIYHFFERENVHWDVILPDVSSLDLTTHLQSHFSDGFNMTEKILDAYDFFNGFADKYPAKITVRCFSLYPTYSFYKFDNDAIISLYPLTLERHPTPTFLIDTDLPCHRFFKSDIENILAHSVIRQTTQMT